MDDQRTDREGGNVKPRFQISLARLFGATFWACLFLGLHWLLWHPPKEMSENAAHTTPIANEWIGCGVIATLAALYIASPCIAVATLINRPILGAVIGLVIGIVVIAESR
jgi:hypothetical protein